MEVSSTTRTGRSVHHADFDNRTRSGQERIDEEFRDALRLHWPEAIGSLLEGIVAIDRDDRLLGANRIAQRLLGTSGVELRRQGVTSLFGVSLAILVDSIRRSEVMPMELMASNGLRLHACAKADWRIAPRFRTDSSEPEKRRSARPDEAAAEDHARTTLRALEVQMILGAVEAAGGNVSLAFKRLGIGRTTIYRKLRPSPLLPLTVAAPD